MNPYRDNYYGALALEDVTRDKPRKGISSFLTTSLPSHQLRSFILSKIEGTVSATLCVATLQTHIGFDVISRRLGNSEDYGTTGRHIGSHNRHLDSRHPFLCQPNSRKILGMRHYSLCWLDCRSKMIVLTSFLLSVGHYSFHCQRRRNAPHDCRVRRHFPRRCRCLCLGGPSQA